MGFNFFELLNKYNQFQQFMKYTTETPEKLLEEELKRRNVTPEELQQMIQEAKQFKKLFGSKL